MNHGHLNLFGLMLFVLVLRGSRAEVQAQDPIPQHETFELRSEKLDETRVICVWTPPGYANSEARFPVLYMPDGGIKEDFPHIANTIAELIQAGEIAPVIVVGIENTDRRRDLTGASEVLLNVTVAPLTDGASVFRAFIRDELFPEIERRYRTTSERAIVGESLAGLFVVETLFREPDMFNRYIAMDPSLWWNDHQLVRKASDNIKALGDRKLRLWFAGSNAGDIFPHTEELERVLKAEAPENLKWTYSPQPNESHGTIFRATKADAFKWTMWTQDPALYDHHVHVLSPTLIKHWKSVGMEFSRPDEAYSNPLPLLENEHLAGAFLISMAHLYAMEDFATVVKSPAQERQLVAAENDYIAACVAKSPERFVGFFSVSPLREYAFEELKRCQANPHLTGLKLHLPACGVDLDNAAHVQRVDNVLSWAAENDVPVLLHLSAGETIDLERSLWFWKTLIGPHAKLELSLAHLGSVGGYNDSSHNILEGYRQLAAADEKFRGRRISFDLSGAIIPAGSEEAEATTAEQCGRLAEQIERLGVERFVFASDYPVFSIRETRESLTAQLPLPAETLQKLLSNKSPRFKTVEQTSSHQAPSQ